MILSKFSLENFLSVRDRLEITFNHPTNNSAVFKNNTIFEYKENNRKRSVLNGGLIVGSNASGKSNILLGMRSMREYYLNSLKFDKKEDVSDLIRPFAFSNHNNNSTKFAIEFIFSNDTEDFIVEYEFSFDSLESSIEKERLSYKKILKSTVSEKIIIFERNNDVILYADEEILGIVQKIAQDNIKHKLALSLVSFDINATFFKKEMNSFSFQVIHSCGGFLEDHLTFSDNNSDLNKFIEAVNENLDFKKYILRNLSDFDFALSDFSVEDITEELVASLKSNKILENFNEDLKKNLLMNVSKNKQYKIETIHKLKDKEYPLPINSESAGTKKFLNNSLNIYNSLLNGRVYISDEFESHYHLRLQEGIINNYISSNPKKAQFLIVSHNPLLLNPTFFAKEQINFVEKTREEESTYIYSLKEFKEVTYNNHSWSQLYISGKLGAVPEVIF